jgi:hypothetical protein
MKARFFILTGNFVAVGSRSGRRPISESCAPPGRAPQLPCSGGCWTGSAAALHGSLPAAEHFCFDEH